MTTQTWYRRTCDGCGLSSSLRPAEDVADAEARRQGYILDHPVHGDRCATCAWDLPEDETRILDCGHPDEEPDVGHSSREEDGLDAVCRDCCWSCSLQVTAY